MNKVFKLSILLFSIYLLSACKYDKIRIEPEIIVNSNLCDSIPSTFSNDILPLLQNKCTPCHVDGSSDGGYSFDNYTGIEPNKDKILSSVKHEQGSQNMPQGSDKLSDQDISKIECWILNGALDN